VASYFFPEVFKDAPLALTRKERRNNYDWLTKPRAEMKRKMAQGLIVI
jgi:hypothetical protein